VTPSRSSSPIGPQGAKDRHTPRMSRPQSKKIGTPGPKFLPGPEGTRPLLDRVAEKRRGFLKSDVVKSYDDFFAQKRPSFDRFPVIKPIGYFGPKRVTGNLPKPHIRHKPTTNAKIYHVVSSTSGLSNTTVVRHHFGPFDTVFECCGPIVK